MRYCVLRALLIARTAAVLLRGLSFWQPRHKPAVGSSSTLRPGVRVLTNAIGVGAPFLFLARNLKGSIPYPKALV